MNGPLVLHGATIDVAPGALASLGATVQALRPDHRVVIIADEQVAALYGEAARGSFATEPVLLTPHTGAVAYTPTAFSPDGKTLYYTTTDGGEFTSLQAMDLATRASRVVHRREWDIETGAVSVTRVAAR